MAPLPTNFPKENEKEIAKDLVLSGRIEKTTPFKKGRPITIIDATPIKREANTLLDAFQSAEDFNSEDDAPGEDDPDLGMKDSPGKVDQDQDMKDTPVEEEKTGNIEDSKTAASLADSSILSSPLSSMPSDAQSTVASPATAAAVPAAAALPATGTAVAQPATGTATVQANSPASSTGTTRPYNRGIGSTIPSSFKPPPMVLGAMELNTYFPFHIRWPDIYFRLYRGGWRSRTIAKAQLHARGHLTKDELKRRDDSLRHAITTAGKDKFGDDFKARSAKYKDHPDLQPVKLEDFTKENGYLQGILEHYDVSDATPSSKEKSLAVAPPSLQQLANGVVNAPQGEHRGLLTQAIEWAAQQTPPFRMISGELFTTDDVEEIVKTQGFELPALAKTAQWDLAGVVEINRVPNPVV